MDIKEYFNSDDIFEIRYLDFNDLIFDGRTREWCMENRCSKYGSCWTCPPGVGELGEIKERLRRYENVVLFSVVGDVKSKNDIDSALNVGKKSRDILINIKNNMTADGFDALALGGGACDICAKCAYPDSKCRYPEKIALPIEACGRNVMETATRFNMKTESADNTITYFAIIFWGCKKSADRIKP